MRPFSSKPWLFLSCLALLASCSASGGSSLSSNSSSSKNDDSSQNSNKDEGSAEKISSEAQNSDKQESVPTVDSEDDSHMLESEPERSDEPILPSSEDPSSSGETSSQDTLSSETSSSTSGEPGNGYPAAGGDFDNSGFTIARSADGLVPEFREGAYLVLEAGSYELSGTLLGMVYVDVPEGSG